MVRESQPAHPARLPNRRTAVKLPLLIAGGLAVTRLPRASAASGRWSTDRVNRWYQSQPWPVGANYVTSTAVNQLEMFQAGTYDARRIDAELRMARAMGINTIRVFLHDQLWTQDRVGLRRRLSQFVTIAARHRIKPLFVLFDSCWDPMPRAGVQRPPRPGVHNSRWVQGPGAERLGDPRYTRVMRDYVVDVMSQFRRDPRVLGWDLWNEPDNPAPQYTRVERSDKVELVAGLLPQVFDWARSVGTIQPLTSGVWDGYWGDAGRRSRMAGLQLDLSDVVTFHSYAKPDEFSSRIDELAPWGRPMICTEYMARTLGSTVEGVLPIAKRHRVGAVTWGLVAGKTQTYLPWDSWDRPYPTPPEWFHDLLHPDGRPYREADLRAMKRLTARPHPK